MAEKITEGRRMSGNILSDKTGGDDDYNNSNKGTGRKNTEKPQIELYRPRMGLTLRRSDDPAWRNSKSPSPCHVESQKPRQVNQNHGKPRNFNKKFESRNGNDSQSRNKGSRNDLVGEMRSLTVNTDGDVPTIDLTLSPTSDEKKRARKPEQAIYVPKPIGEKEQKKPEVMEEENWDEGLKGVLGEGRKKKKPKGRGRGKEEKDERRQFEGRPVQRQMSDASGRFGRDGKGDRRGFRRPEEKRRVEGSKSAVGRELTGRSNEQLDYIPDSSSPEPFRGFKSDKREFRQNEPRPRVRDTRSMEHGWGDKGPSKPPVGRRGSGNIPCLKAANFESLPPRLKKKYMEEKGIPPNTFIGTSSEEQWDGGSLSFSGSYCEPPSYYQYQWSQTVPSPKGRGRGRLRPEEMEKELRLAEERYNNDVPFPSLERNAMPPPNSLPQRGFSHDEVCLSSFDERGFEDQRFSERKAPQERGGLWPRGSTRGFQDVTVIRSRRMSNTSTISTDQDLPPLLKDPRPPSPELHAPLKTLDWSEEVEESERQELAVSRSCSITSLNTGGGGGGERRRGRRRGNRKRSGSRDSIRHPRRQSEESLCRPNSRDRNKGHYGFRRSRESSRERSELWGRPGEAERDPDWRRGGAKEEIEGERDGDWRRGGAKEEVEGDRDGDWRRGEGEGGSWREGKRGGQRLLYDPNNPAKPILINSVVTRTNPTFQEQPPAPVPLPAPLPTFPPPPYLPYTPSEVPPSHPYPNNKDLSSSGKPAWYDHCNESFRRHRNPVFLLDIQRVDSELQLITTNGSNVLHCWARVTQSRQFLLQSLHTLLLTDMKFCQEENVEQHMWKIVFYNLIEALRRSMADDVENRQNYKAALIAIVDEGTQFLEKLLQALQQTYNLDLEEYLRGNQASCKNSPFGRLALISAQKIMLFLGDLARYREVANESNNYGKSKQWYTKAQQLNPKNGRPYYQLAILAYFARRRLDAVYFYMRALMASTPLHSAKESLVSLFDENRKKYEQIQRKRSEERESKYKERAREKEKQNTSLRREIWVHPVDKRRVHRTTSTSLDARWTDSGDEEVELSALCAGDVNKRFTISYLHVHGKLFTRVGMERFQDASVQMLREFRALLQHSPLPLGWTRFLHFLALNMFAIENTQLRDGSLEPGYRSAVQECALIISLQMFNLIVERTVALLREQLDHPSDLRNRLVGEDVQVLLPAVKVWCDWLLCHASVWNPPPCVTEYRVGPPGDAWNRLAELVNLLDKLEHKKTPLVTSPQEGFEMVRLPEDSALSGFTPLMPNEQDPIYTSSEHDVELAECCLRIRKILFFGTVFLCGIEPPMLKLHKVDDISEYISITENSQSQASPVEDQSDTELLVESFSEGEEGSSPPSPLQGLSLEALEMVACPSGAETRRLLLRKEELERRHQRQERHRKRVQDILRQSGLSVVIEVRPRYLVPDTNCFIDYLNLLQQIAAAGVAGTAAVEPHYILAIPLVVLNELEGLARGGREGHLSDPAHGAVVSEAARGALSYLRGPSRGVSHGTIRCVTTNGRFINSFTPFTVEDDMDRDVKNDDRILTTCLSLCRSPGKEQTKPGQTRHLLREVVLLTEDRNLRVKALARDVPVREVPDLALWAGLG